MISEPIYVEMAAHFPDRVDLDGFLTDTRIRLEPSGGKAVYTVGRAWSHDLR